MIWEKGIVLETGLADIYRWLNFPQPQQFIAVIA